MRTQPKKSLNFRHAMRLLSLNNIPQPLNQHKLKLCLEIGESNFGPSRSDAISVSIINRGLNWTIILHFPGWFPCILLRRNRWCTPQKSVFGVLAVDQVPMNNYKYRIHQMIHSNKKHHWMVLLYYVKAFAIANKHLSDINQPMFTGYDLTCW